jgi:mono/diheme cytochrome c family protein
MSDETKSPSTPPEAGPAAGRSHLPMWIFLLLLGLLYFGAIFFDHHSGWFDRQVYAPYASADQLEMYQPKSGAAEALARGKRSYEQNCGTCHGSDGLGKPNQFPPLAGSEWVTAKGMQRLIRIPLVGLNGPIHVKGQAMNFPNGMVAIGATLSDADVAAVLSYIRSAWGNQADEITADDVKKVRADVSSHPLPMTEEEMMKLPQ